jgi:hypothetical protein
MEYISTNWTNGVGAGNLVIAGPLLSSRNSGTLLVTSGRIVMTSSMLRKMLRFFTAWPKLMKSYASNFSGAHMVYFNVTMASSLVLWKTFSQHQLYINNDGYNVWRQHAHAPPDDS